MFNQVVDVGSCVTEMVASPRYGVWAKQQPGGGLLRSADGRTDLESGRRLPRHRFRLWTNRMGIGRPKIRDPLELVMFVLKKHFGVVKVLEP